MLNFTSSNFSLRLLLSFSILTSSTFLLPFCAQAAPGGEQVKPPCEEDRLIVLANATSITQQVLTDVQNAAKDADCEIIDDPAVQSNFALFYLRTKPGKMSEAQIKLQKKSIVKYVQANWILRPCAGSAQNKGTPNTSKTTASASTPNLKQVSKFQSNDPYLPYEWHMTACLVPNIQGNNRAAVGLIDCGVSFHSPEIAALGANATLHDPLNANGTTSNQGDPRHGTPLATTMVGAVDNRLLTAGIVKHPNFKLELVRGKSDGTITDRDLFLAVEKIDQNFALPMTARPVCVPFNAKPPYSLSNQEAHPILHQALKVKHDTQNIMWFVSAGNDGKLDPSPPSNYINVVSAVGRDGKLLPTSNYGNNVTFAAPGEEIFCSDENGQLKNGNGSSYSAAIVAGIAGVIRAVASDTRFPAHTASEFELLLKQFAIRKDNAWTQQYGYGVPNCEGVVNYMDQNQRKIPLQ